MKLSLLVGLIGLAAAGFVGYNFIYEPQQAQVHLIQAQIAEEQVHQQTQAEVTNLLQEVDQYRARLPQTTDPSWLVRELVALAQKAGVQLTTINQDSPQAYEPFTRLGATLQFSASYHQLGTFLDAIERSERFIRVERVHLGASDGAHGAAAVEIACSTLFLPPVLPAASGGGS